MKTQKQKIIKVGNSLAITIPASFVKEGNLAVGDELIVESTPQYGMMLLKKPEHADKAYLSPEFFDWLNDVSIKYEDVIKELANIKK